MSEFATITIQGPGPNAISPATIADLADQLDRAGSVPLLVRGEGNAFSAGLDLKALLRMSVDEFRAFLEGLEALAERLFMHPAPTVAHIHGHCVAGGYFIAACCEHRVSRDDAAIRLGLPAVKLGLEYPPLFMRIVRYALPTSSAEEVLLGSGAFGPQRALELGMIDEISDDAEAAAHAFLARRAALPRHAYAATKTTLRRETTRVTAEEREHFLTTVIPNWADPARIERMMTALRSR